MFAEHAPVTQHNNTYHDQGIHPLVRVRPIITTKPDACGTRYLSPIAVGKKEQGGPSNTGAEYYAGAGSCNWRTAPGKK